MREGMRDRAEFAIHRDVVEATSNHRPDTGWQFIDSAGHVHQWHVNGEPAKHYYAGNKHELPTLDWIIDRVGSWPDGDTYDQGHYECGECGEHVNPRHTADSYGQFIPGLAYYTINGEEVSLEEWERRRRGGG